MLLRGEKKKRKEKKNRLAHLESRGLVDILHHLGKYNRICFAALRSDAMHSAARVEIMVEEVERRAREREGERGKNGALVSVVR